MLGKWWLRAALIGALTTLLLGAFLYGYETHSKKIFPYQLIRRAKAMVRGDAPRPDGHWQYATRRASRAGEEISDDVREVGVLPYLSGYKRAGGASGVTVLDLERAQPGVNLYVSGHRPEASLIDLEGRELHRWRARPVDTWDPGLRPSEAERKQSKNWDFWRRVHLLEDGSLLAIYEGAGLVKVDRDSRPVWAFWGGCHHDLEVLEDGTILVLSRTLHELSRYGRPILEDFLSTLSADGEELQRVSILESFENSVYAPLLDFVPPVPDILHTNSLELLDGTHADLHPAFAAGNVLISLREINTLAVLDLEKKTIPWALTGAWRQQHHPTFLDDGNLLLFNNLLDDDTSQVIELEPLSQRFVWTYEENFFSAQMGTTYRLENGNTLMIESENGRALEVTPEKEIVWEFLNPHRAGENDELIATLFDLIRLDASAAGFVSAGL